MRRARKLEDPKHDMTTENAKNNRQRARREAGKKDEVKVKIFGLK